MKTKYPRNPLTRPQLPTEGGNYIRENGKLSKNTGGSTLGSNKPSSSVESKGSDKGKMNDSDTK